MAEQEVKETQTTQTQVGGDGSTVKQKTSTVENNASDKQTTINAIWYVYGFIAVFLGLRFLLKLFGANSANGFVDFIYTVSGIFSAPFDNIFGVATAESETIEAVFEPSILVALTIYALVAWGLVKLLSLNEQK